MTTPKSPEEILSEYPDEQIDIISSGGTNDKWLRSSMASLLLWASERMPKGTNTFKQWGTPTDFAEDLAGQKRNDALAECRTLLTNEARKITNNE